jgi:predicted aspartyl protease
MLTEVNFRLAGGAQPLILVPVHINDTGAYEFVLDTGAGTSLLSPELARKLSVESTETKEGQTAGGKVQVSMGSVESLAIGRAKVENVQVAIMDLSDLDKAVGAKIDGDIGYNYLKNFRVTVNYKTHTLRLAQGQHETIGKAVLNEISFSLAAPAKPLVLVHALVNGKGAYQFALDTGNSTTMISTELADSLKLKATPIPAITTGGGHTAAAAIGSLDSLAVGRARIQNLPVVIADVLNMLSQVTGAKLDGIIGYNFLKAFTVTIDYPNQVLHLET